MRPPHHSDPQRATSDHMGRWTQQDPRHSQRHLTTLSYITDFDEATRGTPQALIAHIRSAGGEGGAWIYPQTDTPITIPPQHWMTAYRHRMTMSPVTTSGQHLCQMHNATKTCHECLDNNPTHALICPLGGHTTIKHNHIRDALVTPLQTIGAITYKDQHHASCDYYDNQGTKHDGIMDLTCHLHGRTMLVDVSVATAVSADPTRNARRAQHEAAAAQSRENEKRAKYNRTTELIPFVLETNGRWGPTATQWIRHLAPTTPDERSPWISTIRYAVAAALQRHNADMIHRAYRILPP